MFKFSKLYCRDGRGVTAFPPPPMFITFYFLTRVIEINIKSLSKKPSHLKQSLKEILCCNEIKSLFYCNLLTYSREELSSQFALAENIQMKLTSIDFPRSEQLANDKKVDLFLV
jgi:hypothetical protein